MDYFHLSNVSREPYSALKQIPRYVDHGMVWNSKLLLQDKEFGVLFVDQALGHSSRLT